jgi:hypothetical protein
VIVVFFNMRREASRTLYSLSRDYQKPHSDARYRVVALDHGSTEPIDVPRTLGLGVEFVYDFINTTSPSPIAAINQAVSEVDSEYIMIHIDGARILSPGLLDMTWRATQAFERPFVYTLGWHLGPEIQNVSITQGYDRGEEDRLLEDIDWTRDGYRLFEISTLAMSSRGGFLNPIAESNCFTLKRDLWQDLGGFDPQFLAPGGGLANLDFFARACREPGATPVCLLGEGTFHQIHGGVATNVPMERHPMGDFLAEYREIRGLEWQAPVDIDPVYLGRIPAAARRFVRPLK